MKVLDAYVTSSPSTQTMLDIFQGEWSSRLPDHLQLNTQPATARLFEDDRIAWAEENLGSFAGLNILELGPLEGGHSYMCQSRGAARVVAIEANTRAFLKCLVIQNALKLERVEFLLGDFMPFLESHDEKFDLILASGVLYHMQEPLRLLELIARVADRVFLWTHYYDHEIIVGRRDLRRRFDRPGHCNYSGESYECAQQWYRQSLKWAGFCGGSRPSSVWLTRESLFTALRRFGFQELSIGFDQPDHPNGPAVAICARKS